MQNLISPKLNFPLVVAVHDAGASNLILSWLKKIRNKKIQVFLSGPSRKTWDFVKNEKIKDLRKAVSNARMVLTGTSFKSRLENKTRALAKQIGVNSVAVIDHWVNYQERFLNNGRKIIPNEIWVTDKNAFQIAKKEFPRTKIKIQKNLYLFNQIQKIKIISKKKNDSTHKKVLYAFEPIRNKWNKKKQKPEFQAFNYFLKNSFKLGVTKNSQILLRPHPSENKKKYLPLIKRNSLWKLSVDKNKSIEKSIAWADVIAGCETYALYIGLKAGKEVISCLPPDANKLRLPQKQIKELRYLNLK